MYELWFILKLIVFHLHNHHHLFLYNQLVYRNLKPNKGEAKEGGDLSPLFYYLLHDLWIPWKPILASWNCFNVNFVDKEFSSFSATCSISHNYMRNCQSQWTNEKSSFHGWPFSTTTPTQRIWSFYRNKHQRWNTTYHCGSKVWSSGKFRPITKTINTDYNSWSDDGDERDIYERISEIIVSEMGI